LWNELVGDAGDIAFTGSGEIFGENDLSNTS